MLLGVIRWVAGALTVLVTLAIGSAPVAAHDELLSTKPANGAELTTAPATIVLTFAAAPIKGTTKLAASVRGGQGFVLEDVTVEGAVVTAVWPFDKPPGTYSIAWRSVGTDGHPLTGTFDFSFTTARTPASASPSITPTPSATPSVSASPVATTTDSGSTYWLIPTLVAVVVLIIAIAALFALRRSRNSADR